MNGENKGNQTPHWEPPKEIKTETQESDPYGFKQLHFLFKAVRDNFAEASTVMIFSGFIVVRAFGTITVHEYIQFVVFFFFLYFFLPLIIEPKEKGKRLYSLLIFFYAIMILILSLACIQMLLT